MKRRQAAARKEFMQGIPAFFDELGSDSELAGIVADLPAYDPGGGAGLRPPGAVKLTISQQLDVRYIIWLKPTEGAKGLEPVITKERYDWQSGRVASREELNPTELALELPRLNREELEVKISRHVHSINLGVVDRVADKKLGERVNEWRRKRQ